MFSQQTQPPGKFPARSPRPPPPRPPAPLPAPPTSPKPLLGRNSRTTADWKGQAVYPRAEQKQVKLRSSHRRALPNCTPGFHPTNHLEFSGQGKKENEVSALCEKAALPSNSEGCSRKQDLVCPAKPRASPADPEAQTSLSLSFRDESDGTNGVERCVCSQGRKTARLRPSQTSPSLLPPSRGTNSRAPRSPGAPTWQPSPSPGEGVGRPGLAWLLVRKQQGTLCMEFAKPGLTNTFLMTPASQALKAATATCLHPLGAMGTQADCGAVNPGQRKGPGSPPASEQKQRSALIYLFLGRWDFFFLSFLVQVVNTHC